VAVFSVANGNPKSKADDPDLYPGKEAIPVWNLVSLIICRLQVNFFSCGAVDLFLAEARRHLLPEGRPCRPPVVVGLDPCPSSPSASAYTLVTSKEPLGQLLLHRPKDPVYIGSKSAHMSPGVTLQPWKL
jgi:hypothetical protein